jgi:hypothetical protein
MEYLKKHGAFWAIFAQNAFVLYVIASGKGVLSKKRPKRLLFWAFGSFRSDAVRLTYVAKAF